VSDNVEKSFETDIYIYIYIYIYNPINYTLINNEDNNNQRDLQERIKNANKTYFPLLITT